MAGFYFLGVRVQFREELRFVAELTLVTRLDAHCRGVVLVDQGVVGLGDGVVLGSYF